MKEELEQALVKDFPELYIDHDADMTQTCMCWGFECGDGWEPLIRELSEKLTVVIKDMWPDEDGEIPRASQVKEKFGTLRFYMSYGTDEIYDLIEEAEKKSAITCEVCADNGSLKSRDSWVKTLCNACADEFGYTTKEKG